MLAQLLQEELNLNNRHVDLSQAPTVKIQRELWNTLEEARNGFSKFNNSDVHVFNKQFVQKYRPLLLDNFVKLLGLSDKNPLDTIIEKLEPYAKGSFHASVKQMKSHGLSQVDRETGLRLDHTLSYVFAVCKLISGLPHVRYNPWAYLARSFEENIDRKGGCHPGYTGRVFRDFTYLIYFYLSNVTKIFS